MMPNYQNIPEEMRLYNQWVVWRYEDTEATKPTKVPYSANNGRLANVNSPATWCSYEQAVHAVSTTSFYDGIGFVLTDGDPFAFVDLDDTKGDQQAFERQLKIYNEFQSYAERSPSGTGLHIIVKGSIPSGRKRSSIEIYSSARYMTMTGDIYRNSPIFDCHELLNLLHNQMGGTNTTAAHYAGLAHEIETDEQIIERAMNAANGDKFAKLWNGDWSDYPPNASNTHSSEADFALVDILAFYTQNRAQIARLFRASGLGKRDKAQRDDYVGYMLNKCFDRMLPPVDIEGLKERLEIALKEKQQQEEQSAPSQQNAANQAHEEPINIAEAVQPQNNVYSVPPGLVGHIARFIYEAAPRPVAETALAAAIGLLAGIVGRAYNVSGTGLNQYILVLAETGTGKEAAASGIDKLFAQVVKTIPESGQFIGPSEIASAQAITKYMSKGPNSFVSLVGEFGMYLQQMASVNAPPHLVGLRRFLLDAYNKSGCGKMLRPSIYSDKDKNTNTVVAPAMTLFGESTPEKFYEGLHEGLISEGLLPRFTTIEYHGKRPPLNKNHLNVKPSFELIDKVSTVCAHALMLNSQNKVIDVMMHSDAERLFDEFDKHCDLQINCSDREIRRHLWNRAHIKALKMAALVAVGCNPYDPCISFDVANWAINLIVADVKNLLDRFNSGEIGVDNDEMKQLSKVCKVVKEFIVSPWPEVVKYAGDGMGQLHSNKIIPFSFIQRKLASISVFRKDRIGASNAIKRALTTLTERGDLQEVSRATLSKEYNTTARAFMISNPKAFEL